DCRHESLAECLRLSRLHRSRFFWAVPARIQRKPDGRNETNGANCVVVAYARRSCRVGTKTLRARNEGVHVAGIASKIERQSHVNSKRQSVGGFHRRGLLIVSGAADWRISHELVKKSGALKAAAL